MAKADHIVTLYKRQREVVEFISQFWQRNGYSPTLREIADAMGLSSLATVHEHVQNLCDKGVLRKTSGNRSRGIIVVDDSLSWQNQGVNLPILGWFSNGTPIEPYSDRAAKLQVSAEMMSGTKRAFALEIWDDKLAKEGIYKKDMLVVEESMDIKDGDVVIAILANGNAVMKRFYQEMTKVRLEPLVSNDPPFYAARVAIQGKVLGSIRMFGEFFKDHRLI